MKRIMERGKPLRSVPGFGFVGVGKNGKRSEFATTKCASFIFCKSFDLFRHFEFGGNFPLCV